MVEIYCGEGKGKTTAAAGLALRAAGRGRSVLFVQFLKDGSSGEIAMMKVFEEIEILLPKKFYGFLSGMTDVQKEKAKEDAGKMLEEIRVKVREMEFRDLYSFLPDEGEAVRGVVILDEVFHAVNAGLIEEEELLDFIREIPPEVELVMTGRDPSEKLLAEADYISEIISRKHPYEKGVSAREGIEY
jgi:cob(I)alamin adenosyltransferase